MVSHFDWLGEWTGHVGMPVLPDPKLLWYFTDISANFIFTAFKIPDDVPALDMRDNEKLGKILPCLMVAALGDDVTNLRDYANVI